MAARDRQIQAVVIMTTSTSVTLRNLPPPEIIEQCGRLPWQTVNLRELAEILGADPCQVAMWIYRGKGPPSLPASWFANRIRAFRLSAVQRWLGDNKEPEWQIWQHTIAQTLGENLTESDCRRRSAELVQLLGEKGVKPAGTKWARGAFRDYVAQLRAA